MTGLTIHPEILKVMGEYLVSDPVVAISELVKNAYDADATRVFVRITTKLTQQIVIEDDGHGMNLDEIKNGWLMIGTPMKRERTRSKYGNRILSGSMGIGRLAAFSLANILEVETLAKGESTRRRFSLNLKELLSLQDLSNFDVTILEEGEISHQSGTRLTLRDLKWHITEDEIKRLATRLSILCSPAKIADFSIIVEVDGEPSELSPLRDLPSPPISIGAIVNATGQVEVTIKSNPLLFDGNLKKKSWKETLTGPYRALVGVKIDAFWYPLGERSQGRYWKITTRSRFAQDMREELSGVRVYRDGIRVLPYGEPENDWLDLERTYVSGGSKQRNPRRSQVVAWINVSRETNPDLRDTANREGLVENSAYHELRTLGKRLFASLAEYRRIIEPVVRKEHELTFDDMAAVEKIVSKVKLKLAEDPQLSSDFSMVERYISAFEDQMERTALYRDRLTAGNLINHIVHDVGAAAAEASGYVLKVGQEKCDQEKHGTAFQIVADLFPRILSAYEILKGGSRAGAQRVSNVNVSDLAKKIAEQMKSVSYLSADSIQAETGNIVARLRASDFWAIVANLLVNAITCSEYEQAKSRDFPKDRKIVLSLKAEKTALKITCEDNGPGLPDKPEDWMWQPFNSTRKDSGSGLGLYIISDIVTWYGGTKKAEKSGLFKTGARFEITLEGVISDDQR